jgi:hypothetical protein
MCWRALQIEADSRNTTFAAYKTRFPAPGTPSQPLANGKVRSRQVIAQCSAERMSFLLFPEGDSG